MPIPPYIVNLRRSFGSGRLLLPGVSAAVLRESPDTGRPQLLLVERSDTGEWSLPAGIVEPGEQPAATLVRELWEETRVVVEIERLALLSTDPDVHYDNGDVCQYVSMCFRARYVSGDAEIGDDESTAVAWYDLDALPEMDELQHQRIDAALSDEQACRFRV